MAAWPKYSWRYIGATSLITLPLIALSLEIAKDDPSVSTSEIMPKAQHSLLLDIAKSGTGFVAVGERGNIITSVDGQSWVQSKVPTRSTLTTVSVQGSNIWAAGHDGVIIYSNDSGKTWQRQRVQPWSADSQEITNGSAIMDTLFVDENIGYALGSYSLMLKTQDGGKTWDAVDISGSSSASAPTDMVATNSGTFDANDLTIAAEDDPHLNSITRTQSGKLIVMGERGAGFRSDDDGATWQKLRLPYGGSMFGVISLGGEKILTFGLRGNVFESNDAGSTWTKIETGTDVSLQGGTVSDDGTVVLVGSNGALFVKKSNQSAFVLRRVQLKTGQGPAFSAVIPSNSGYMLTSDLGHIFYQMK
jgi:photosystem II stability/assembly factor-like uncharacterized protein